MSARVGKTSLGPITIAHVVAMESFGIVVSDRNLNDPTNSCIGLWLISKPINELSSIVNGMTESSEITKWMERFGIKTEECSGVLNTLMSDAFKTYVPPKPDSTKVQLDDIGEGYGWPLEIAECIAHEYGLDLRSVFEWPLSTAFASIATMRQRSGGEAGGPDYYGRIRDQRMAEIFSRKNKNQT